MTTTSTIADVESPDAAPTRRASVTVRTVELIVGRQLEFPLHDSAGVLLLSAGSEITAKFKQLLLRRGVDQVEVDPKDRDRVTLMASTAEEAESFDPALTAPLDDLIESGALFVANTGPAVSERVVLNGCRAYDRERRATILEEHAANGASLDNMLREAMHGGSLKGANIAQLAGSYISHFTADADCVVDIATQAGQSGDIAEHCLRMSVFGMSIGIEMGLDERNVRDLGLCGLVHDWGMIRVPERIRSAPRVLSEGDFLEIKKHPMYALEMLQNVSGLPTVVPLVCYQVHEQPNGGGYPRGRSGNSIHIFARILKVADVYAGMLCRRPFRPPFSAYSAMECLVRQSQQKTVDPRVVRTMLNLTGLFPIGSHVVLADDRIARVIRRNGDHYTQPIVQIVQRADGTTDGETVVDLVAENLTVRQALAAPGSDEIMLDPEQLQIARK